MAYAADSTALAANTVIKHSSLDAAGFTKRPFTITRMVGLLSIQSDQNAAVETVFGALGACVVSEEAEIAGVAALPDPTTNPASDLWFLFQNFAAEGSSSTNVGRPIQNYQFDSRAQRKVEEGSDIVVMLANASAADGLLFILNYRILIKLS